MLNRYPLWKNLLILGMVAVAILYSIANLYRPDPAVQITASSSTNSAGDVQLEQAIAALDRASISYKAAEIGKNSILIRLNDSDMQLAAKDLIHTAVGNDYVVALNMADTTPSWLSNIGASPMSLGLDLAGGVHFLMEVDMKKYIENKQKSYVEGIKSQLREEKVRYTRVDANGTNGILATFINAEQRDTAKSLIEEQYTEFLISSIAADQLKLTLTDASIEEFENFAIEQNLITLNNRVNELGVAEPLVQRQGRNRIVVELPGVQDTAQAKKILGKAATLEFRLVAASSASNQDSEIFEFRDTTRLPRTSRLEKEIIIEGKNVTNAIVGTDENGALQVNVDLDSKGGARMTEVTKKNVGNLMATLFIENKSIPYFVEINGKQEVRYERIDDIKIISQATIQSVLGSSFRITGLNGPGEAAELALLLRAGALAAPMGFVEERTIGPSLGAENIAVGLNSLLVGLALVVLVMIAIYRVFGVLAVASLAVNILLITAIMSILPASLTLPGIAGIVLTVGMAVDANVLIFSRIREELNAGMSPQGAIHAGYERAFVTILDANITTLLVAMILFFVGTGPVKGFAVTLAVGIMTSMFTAIMVTRALTNLTYGGRNIDKISVGSLRKTKEYNFMGVRKYAAMFSVALVLGSIGSLAVKGLNFGLDFTGGALIEVQYEQPANVEVIRQSLDEAGYKNATVQLFGSDTDVLIRMQQENADESMADVGASVLTLLRSSGEQVTLLRNEFVGPSVGEELKEQGGLGMLIALIMVMFYVAFRFQMKFSVGAVVALAHDVIIVLGFFSITGLDFDLTVLAAVLAVIGYSLNDTIVVADRIRENFRNIHDGNPVDIINISTSETLGRTIMTSLTTTLVLLAMFFIGGDLIKGFSVALLVGIGIGTYSSIYVAANVLLLTRLTKQDLMPPEKLAEEEIVDEKPSWLQD